MPTTISQPSHGGSQVPLSVAMPWSNGRLMVPPRPSRNSISPSQPISPASVTTNDGMPSWVNMRPCSTPISAATPSPASTASTGGQCCLTYSSVMTTAQSPLTEPADRSISPSSSTMMMPSAMVPVAAICRARLVRFSADRNRSFSPLKITAMITSPTATGAAPRSPRRRRSLAATAIPRIRRLR
jgi:hypothetical protein